MSFGKQEILRLKASATKDSRTSSDIYNDANKYLVDYGIRAVKLAKVLSKAHTIQSGDVIDAISKMEQKRVVTDVSSSGKNKKRRKLV